MAVGDKTVWKQVESAWMSSRTSGGSVGGYIARWHETWKTLLALRETSKGALDQNLAAAEHYAYARFFCATTGDTVVLLGGDSGL